MREDSAEWTHATRLALEAYESTLLQRSENRSAVAAALARMRTIVPTATESDVREALALLLAARRLTLSSERLTMPTKSAG
jgi:hypothetical protein